MGKDGYRHSISHMRIAVKEQLFKLILSLHHMSPNGTYFSRLDEKENMTKCNLVQPTGNLPSLKGKKAGQ